MKTIAAILTGFMALLILACSKSNSSAKVSSGTYAGNSYKSCEANEYCVVFDVPTIQITLSSGKFKSQSLMEQLPDATCQGNYNQKGDSIYFDSDCSPGTMNDPTLALQGAYKVMYNKGDSLSFRRSLDLTYPEYPIVSFNLKRTGGN